MSSPTQRSKKLLEDRGYLVAIVEKWNPHAMVRQDLFGMFDLLCVHKESGEVVSVQTTAASGVSARVKKIADHPNLPIVRKANWKLVVHGWRKSGNRWIVREVDVS
jgi:hypothetical protein